MSFSLVSLGPWAGALATLLAVLVALRLHLKVFPPKLRLTALNPDGDRTTLSVTTEEGGLVVSTRPEEARFYRVSLTNERRWVVATDVSVHLVCVALKDATGDYFQTWSGSVALTATSYGKQPPGRLLGVAPLEYDVCYILRNKWLQLTPEIVPNNVNVRYRVGAPIQLRLTLQARSLEALSQRFLLEVAWDGAWEEDTTQMRRHMVFREMSR